MLSHPWYMVATILFVAAHICMTVNSVSEGDHKISSLPGQPPEEFQQYAGYITVDDEHQRALFYYFVEAEGDPTFKPLVLWLAGGPGASSVGRAFMDYGPFKPTENALVKNDYSWNKEANMLFLESPAGVGFSYSVNKSCYGIINDEFTARDNLVFLQRWFEKFPQYRSNDFFISGASYGGHFVSELAQLIIQTKTQFNLKGIAIGNPLLEFNTDMNSRAEFLWSHGLISDSTYESLTTVCNLSQIERQTLISGSLTSVCEEVAKQASQEIGKNVDLGDVTLDVCLSTVPDQHSLMLNQLQKTQNIDVCVFQKVENYLNKKDVQEALHAKLVGVTTWSISSKVLKYDLQDIEIPTLPILGKLVESGVQVMVYSGDQDVVIPLIGTRKLVNGLAKEMGLNTTVPHRSWFQGRQVGGWTQAYGDILSFATVRGGGHSAPFSQPERSLLLFKTFLKGLPLPDAPPPL